MCIRDRHYSIAQAPGMEDHTLVVNSLSKTYAMTGWRVGYVVSSNLEIMTKMVKMQQALISDVYKRQHLRMPR